MNQQKILIMTKQDISSWKSCQHITRNLLQSYIKAHPLADVKSYMVHEEFSSYESYRCAKEVKEMKVDLIVWLDHKPCAANMLIALSDVYADTPFELRPKFLIHLFGDFVLDCTSWENAQDAINHYPVHFFAASDRQKKLIDKFFAAEKSVVSVVPFPVDEQSFSIKNLDANRDEVRKKFGIKDEVIFVYTGRISYQKNVDAVINAMEKLKSLVDAKIQLWVVGSFDDILIPYFGMYGALGSYFSQFNAMNSKKDMSYVRFMGNLDTEDLQKVYHASDVFVSFSTFNDEDYGMSVAEALMTGLPCVLSDWGGFSSFTNYNQHVELVQVDYQEPKMVINVQAAQKKLFKVIHQVSLKDFSREMVAQEAGQFLSVNSVGKKLDKIIKDLDCKNDVRYSSLLYKTCGLFLSISHAPFRNNNKIYKEIYGDYASN